MVYTGVKDNFSTCTNELGNFICLRIAVPRGNSVAYSAGKRGKGGVIGGGKSVFVVIMLKNTTCL
jgi:hypothetical protein